MRVVSLVPSVTETLLAWGISPVACTRFCEQPDLLHVGGTKDPDIGAIAALRPDLVVVDREENRREDAEALVASGLRIHVTHVRSVADVDPMCAALGSAVGLDVDPALGGDLGLDDHQSAESAESAESAVVAVATPCLFVTSPYRRTAFVPIWRRPWMSINAQTYGGSVLAALGVDLVTATLMSAYPAVELAEMAALSPDLVLLPTEPYPFAERHIAEMKQAFPSAEVAIIDGQDLFWWGARTAAALDRLSVALST
jgi:ABC-type Fe3+-hydroxamate transport system substrate-binding protein